MIWVQVTKRRPILRPLAIMRAAHTVEIPWLDIYRYRYIYIDISGRSEVRPEVTRKEVSGDVGISDLGIAGVPFWVPAKRLWWPVKEKEGQHDSTTGSIAGQVALCLASNSRSQRENGSLCLKSSQLMIKHQFRKDQGFWFTSFRNGQFHPISKTRSPPATAYGHKTPRHFLGLYLSHPFTGITSPACITHVVLDMACRSLLSLGFNMASCTGSFARS